MLPGERQEKLLDELYKRGSLSIQEIAQELDVSIVTIRRDFNELSRRGLLKKIYGGAELPTRLDAQIMNTARHAARVMHHNREKKLIAAAAAAKVKEGDIIALDMGTTTLEIAKCLKYRKNITVVTNSLPIMTELLDGSPRLIFLGGSFRASEMATYGPLTLAELDNFRFETACIGCNGISSHLEITDRTLTGVEIHRKLLSRARKKILAADSSKFGTEGPIVTGPVTCVDEIITDDGIPADISAALTKLGVRVTAVGL